MISLTFGARKSFYRLKNSAAFTCVCVFFFPNYVVKVFQVVALSMYIEDQTKQTTMFKGVNPWNQNQRPQQNPNEPEAKSKNKGNREQA